MCESSTDTIKDTVITTTTCDVEEGSTNVDECVKQLANLPSLDSITIPDNKALQTNADELEEWHSTQRESLSPVVDAPSMMTTESKRRKKQICDSIDDAAKKAEEWRKSDETTVKEVQNDAEKLLEASKAVANAKKKCDSSTERMKGEVTCDHDVNERAKLCKLAG